MTYKHSVANIEDGIECHTDQCREKHGAEQFTDLSVSKVNFISFHNGCAFCGYFTTIVYPLLKPVPGADI